MAELIDRARDRTMLHLSNLGTDILQKKDRWLARNPPDLLFFHLDNTRRIFKRLSSPSGYAGDGKMSFDDDYTAIEGDVPLRFREPGTADSRIESHLKFLALSAAFAAADHWAAAQRHAESAEAIITRREGSIPPIGEIEVGKARSNLSGREAGFLIALCKRVRARNEDDLNNAEEALAVVEERFHQDEAAGEVIPDRDRVLMRQEVERTSIALSRYYIQRRSCEECAYIRQPCDTCAGHLRALMASVPVRDGQGEDKAACPTLTDLSDATNTIQLYVISTFWEGCHGWSNAEAPVHCEGLARAVACLDWIERGKLFIFNEQVRAYWIAGRILRAEQDLRTDAPSSEEIGNTLQKLPAYSITIFDKWRTKNLMHFIRERTGS